MAMDLTVGQVSGVIAAGVVVVKVILPTLLTFHFLGMLNERDNAVTASAVSWSTIGRLLHSYWPTILGSDTAALSGVRFNILFFRYAGILGTMLISIAAIVTPLGLSESTVPDRPALERFHHVPDDGIFGRDTPARNSSLPWSRVCGGLAEPITCPDLTRAPTTSNHSVDRSIPEETIDLFSSGVAATSSSISSIFDIQWRSWSWTSLSARTTKASNPSLVGDTWNERYPFGVYRQISTLILEDGYKIIDGLVVDATNGGIGFRNHSAPSLTAYGSTWTEDLLFIEPVSSCVDTNLTLDYTILDEDILGANSPTRLTLTDRGGFSELDATYPEWDLADVQRSMQLWERAYQAAWLSNVFSMKKFNVSNVTLGSDPYMPLILHEEHSVQVDREYPIPQTESNCCFIDRRNAGAIAPNEFGCYAANSSMASRQNGSFEAVPSLIKNLCEGGDYDKSRGMIGDIAAYCDLILGSSLRSDGFGGSLPFHTAGSRWSKPMYSCAMSLKAIIKSVTFSYNTTDDFAGLAVRFVEDKTYGNEAEYPIWGVENLSDMGHFWMMPLWGLVSREVADNFTHNQLRTVQRPYHFLPRRTTLSRVTGPSVQSHQSLAGVEFPDAGLDAIPSMAVGALGTMDYTGEGNLALAQKWSTLSSRQNQ